MVRGEKGKGIAEGERGNEDKNRRAEEWGFERLTCGRSEGLAVGEKGKLGWLTRGYGSMRERGTGEGGCRDQVDCKKGAT